MEKGRIRCDGGTRSGLWPTVVADALREGVGVLPPGKMMQMILARQGAICMVALFPSQKAALAALTRLPYASVTPEGEAVFSKGIMGALYKTKAGATLVIGGPMSQKQRDELYAVVQKHGRVEGFTFSGGGFGPGGVGGLKPKDRLEKLTGEAAHVEEPRRPVKTGAVAVEADTGADARIAAASQVPAGAEITRVVQVQAVEKGFLGVRKRRGLFKVHYEVRADEEAPGGPAPDRRPAVPSGGKPRRA